jgi:hypothetical protein
MRYLTSCVLLTTLFAAAPVSAQATAHAHHEPANVEATAIGHRWHADAPLREGMARIRKAHQALTALERGQLASDQVVTQADEILAAVNFMFANCRLAPEPDAALHPLLAQLLGASQALQKQPSDPAPVAEVETALARYAQLFDESGPVSKPANGSVATPGR